MNTARQTRFTDLLDEVIDKYKWYRQERKEMRYLQIKAVITEMSDLLVNDTQNNIKDCISALLDTALKICKSHSMNYDELIADVIERRKRHE